MADEKDEKTDEIKSQEEELEKFFAEEEEVKTEEEKTMTKEDVVVIVRDELKTFWKGVIAGKYPLPKNSTVEEPPKESEEAEDEERDLTQAEGIVIPLIIKPIVETEILPKPEVIVETEEKKENTEEKNTDEKVKIDDSKPTEEQETQVAELQKTIDGMKKELEDLKAEPQKSEENEKNKKQPYRSDFVVEGGKITRR